MCERGPCKLFSSSFTTTAYSCEPRRSNSDARTGNWSSPSQLTRSRNPCHSRTMAELYDAATAAYPKFAFTVHSAASKCPLSSYHRMISLGLNQKISCQSSPTRCMRRSRWSSDNHLHSSCPSLRNPPFFLSSRVSGQYPLPGRSMSGNSCQFSLLLHRRSPCCCRPQASEQHVHREQHTTRPFLRRTLEESEDGCHA